MDDTLAVEEDDELEEEADAEVDKVLFDLTNGKLGQAGTVQTELLASRSVHILNTPLKANYELYSPVEWNWWTTRRPKGQWSSTVANWMVC